jgi:hypothetical protein
MGLYQTKKFLYGEGNKSEAYGMKVLVSHVSDKGLGRCETAGSS